MSLQAIHGALASHLATFAAAQTPALPVAYENRDFDPPEGVYLREHLLPAEPAAAALGTDAPNRHRGILQVDVLGEAGQGSGPVSIIVDALTAHFKRGTKLPLGDSEIAIERAYPGPAMQDNGRYRVPVNITFYAYVAN